MNDELHLLGFMTRRWMEPQVNEASRDTQQTKCLCKMSWIALQLSTDCCGTLDSCVSTEIQVPGSGVESHSRRLVTLVILRFRGAFLDGPCLSRSYVQWSTETSELAARLAQQHSSVWCGLRRNLRQVDHHPAGLKAQTFFCPQLPPTVTQWRSSPVNLYLSNDISS